MSVSRTSLLNSLLGCGWSGMWRQIKFNACAAIQVVVSVVRVSTVIVLGAHTQVIVVVQDIAAVAVGIGAATFTELGGILVLAIALEGLAVGEWGALGLGNASYNFKIRYFWARNYLINSPVLEGGLLGVGLLSPDIVSA